MVGSRPVLKDAKQCRGKIEGGRSEGGRSEESKMEGACTMDVLHSFLHTGSLYRIIPVPEGRRCWRVVSGTTSEVQHQQGTIIYILVQV